MTSLARPTPGLALVLALALALAPAFAGSTALAQEQGPSNGGQADEANGSQRDANRSDEEADGGEEGQADRRGGQDGSPDRGQGDERRPDEAGRAPPVEIHDRPGGFATRAPPDQARPNVAVDARNASATVERDDVRPLDLHLDQVVEFVDQDGDGAYDVGEPVENRTSLNEAPSRVEADEANETRTVVYELGEEGQLRLVFDLGTAHAEDVGTKFDVVVDGYAFGREDARIALGSRIQVDGGIERVEIDGQPALAGETGEQVSYLSWVPTVQVDGADHPVASSVHVDAEEPAESAIVYWAYPQGEEIVHDPALGVRDAIRDLAGQIAPFALGLAATATLLFGGYAARARWQS